MTIPVGSCLTAAVGCAGRLDSGCTARLQHKKLLYLNQSTLWHNYKSISTMGESLILDRKLLHCCTHAKHNPTTSAL